MDIDYKMIGKRIKHERSKLNMSQMLLAEKANLSVPYISYVETGKKKISLGALLQIADAMNTTPDILLRDILNSPTNNTPDTIVCELSDCTNTEKAIISDTIKVLKYSMRIHKV